MPTGVLFGLTAALCWGVADVCARGAARTAGTFTTLLWVQAVGAIALLAVGLPTGLLRLDDLPPGATLAAAGLSIGILAGAGLLYRAFAIGKLALVSPIASSFAALTALLAIATGERPTVGQVVGIVVTLGGVALASAIHDPGQEKQAPGQVADAPMRSPRRWRPAPGVLLALAALVCFGVTYWALKYVVADLGGMRTAFVGKVAEWLVVLVLAAVGLLMGPRRDGRPRAIAPRRPSAAFWVALLPTALFDTAANVAYNLGIASSLTSIVAVISSLFSPVTVLLAWIFLRERLTPPQWVGVLAIFVGIVLVGQ